VLVQTDSVTKLYPMGVRALDRVSFKIDRGEFVAVMGRSGSGKSTLLQILGCLDRPTSGQVWIDGLEVTGMPDRALPPLRLNKLGFVFQGHNLIPSLTALENTELPLRYLRPTPAFLQGRTRAQQMLREVGLEDRIHHLPGELSGGQQQRVAVARALVNGPALILADEPTGSLDSQTAQEMMELMRRLCLERAQTFVIVTHDPLVVRYADRVLTMADGRISPN